ncbi:MAG: hypothetical protein VCB63_09790 [Alphaproteobacteria bacterium]
MLFNAAIDPEMTRLYQGPIVTSYVRAGIHVQDQTCDKLLRRSIQIDDTLDNILPAHKILGRIEFGGVRIAGQIGRGENGLISKI